jgi:hypothetical protein
MDSELFDYSNAAFFLVDTKTNNRRRALLGHRDFDR